MEATQLKNKIKHVLKSKVNVDSLKNIIQNVLKNNKLVSNSLQRFRSEKHNVFTEEVNKIVLSTNDDKRIQSINSIETYPYRTSKDLIRKKKETKYNNIIKNRKK